jgi:hypothetical protein
VSALDKATELGTRDGTAAGEAWIGWPHNRRKAWQRQQEFPEPNLGGTWLLQTLLRQGGGACARYETAFRAAVRAVVEGKVRT